MNMIHHPFVFLPFARRRDDLYLKPSGPQKYAEFFSLPYAIGSVTNKLWREAMHLRSDRIKAHPDRKYFSINLRGYLRKHFSQGSLNKLEPASSSPDEQRNCDRTS